ncbi:hypothetical protein ACWGDS_14775 [Streptomyces sp. NPDC055059]|uniref:hypothetical protein n=1 Tax=unclassified Streptomyces TaxID=2593676 RepID=UPI0033A526C0
MAVTNQPASSSPADRPDVRRDQRELADIQVNRTTVREESAQPDAVVTGLTSSVEYVHATLPVGRAVREQNPGPGGRGRWWFGVT